jgi:hypothetical protein
LTEVETLGVAVDLPDEYVTSTTSIVSSLQTRCGRIRQVVGLNLLEHVVDPAVARFSEEERARVVRRLL